MGTLSTSVDEALALADLPELEGFCEERTPDGTLACDMLPGHTGTKHRESGVAAWNRDGSGLRWYDERTRRYNVACA